MPLTQPHARWLEAILEADIGAEPGATCDRCTMCAPRADELGISERMHFSPVTKCCTYTPKLPNFRVGEVLARLDLPAGAVVRRAVLQRRGATPLALTSGPGYADRYGVGPDAVVDFGRDPSMRCPYFDTSEGGRCGIWPHWEGVCATWFCQHRHGAAGARFWQTVREYLVLVEEQLALHCALTLDLSVGSLDELVRDDGTLRRLDRRELRGWVDDDGALEDSLARRVWGGWYGREVEFYERCAQIVAPLDAHDIEQILGPMARVAGARVRASFAARERPAHTPPQGVTSCVVTPDDGEHVLLSTFEQRLPIRIRSSTVELLDQLDDASSPSGAGIDDATLQSLELVGACVPVDGRDIKRAEQPSGPILPEDHFRCFRGFRGWDVKVDRRIQANGRVILTFTCGPKEVVFDEPHLLAFGEGLYRFRNGFRAGDVTTWSIDGYSWDTVVQMLKELLEDRVLQRLPRRS